MIKFYDRLIGNNQPPFIIAEACINHEGDITIAKEMIQIAKSMGADSIKFQIECIYFWALRMKHVEKVSRHYTSCFFSKCFLRWSGGWTGSGSSYSLVKRLAHLYTNIQL